MLLFRLIILSFSLPLLLSPKVYAQDEVKQVDLLQTHKVSAFVASFPTINQFNDRLINDGLEPLFKVPKYVAVKHKIGASGLVLEQQVLELKNDYPEHYDALKNALKDLFDIKSNPMKNVHDFGTPEEWGAYGDRILLAHGNVSAASGSKNLKMMNERQSAALEQMGTLFENDNFNGQTINGISVKEYAKNIITNGMGDAKDIVSSYMLAPQHDRDIVEPFKVQIAVQLLKYN